MSGRDDNLAAAEQPGIQRECTWSEKTHGCQHRRRKNDSQARFEKVQVTRRHQADRQSGHSQDDQNGGQGSQQANCEEEATCNGGESAAQARQGAPLGQTENPLCQQRHTQGDSKREQGDPGPAARINGK